MKLRAQTAVRAWLELRPGISHAIYAHHMPLVYWRVVAQVGSRHIAMFDYRLSLGVWV